MSYKIKGNVVVSGTSLTVNAVEVVKETTAQTITNKTIDADQNTITNIENADIKAGAAIDAAKLADGSVSNTEFQYLNGVTSAIQDQLDDKANAALAEDNIYVGNAGGVATAVDTSALGDIEATTAGGLAIKTGVIVNADINASAAIELSKLEALTANRALQSDGAGEISASAVTATELGYVSGVTSAIQTQLNAKLALAGGTMSGDIAMAGNKVTGLGAPTLAADAATKSYVDSVAEGLKPKTAARVATTTAGTLATSFENGDTVDDIVLATGDRLLIKDQAAPAENGIYIVQASGAPVRATDFDSLTPIDEVNGAMVAVQEGTANAGKVFVQSGLVATIGTDPINFIFFNSSASLVGGDGITVSGNNVSVDHDGEGLTFAAAQLALELDGATLSKSATGLKVADLGIDTTQLAANAVTAAKIATSVAGDGIAGGGGSALSIDHDGQGLDLVAGQLALELDGATLSKSATGLRVASGGITPTELAANAVTEDAIAASALGDGLTGGGGTVLSVDHDGQGLEFVLGQLSLELDGASLSKTGAGLKIADLGVNTAQIADSAVDEDKLNASVAGDGIAGGGGTPLSVDHDGEGLQFVSNQLALEIEGTTLSKSSNGIKVATGGITNTEINASAAIARNKLATGTANGIVYNDAGGVMVSTAALTNGQLLIGQTGGSPVEATLTAGTGISITNGAGTITIAASGGSANDIPETSFSAANNVASPANVTGLAFANANVRSFEALVSITLIATAEAYEVRTLRGVQKNGSWDMSETSNGDDSGVVFSITNAGQVQYTSANSAGFSSNTIKFRAITTAV